MLTADQIATYREVGLARIHGVLAEQDLAMLRREWARLWGGIATDHVSVQWRGHSQEIRKADRLDPAYLLSGELHSLCEDRRLTSIADAALGVRAVFFKDKLITKGSGTHGYGLHQDWPYWARFGVPADKMVTLQIAIDASDAANGAVEVWPKANGVLPSPPEDALDVDPDVVDPGEGQLVALKAGDVFLLHPLAPHRSGINNSDRLRRTYFITYVAADHEDAARRRHLEMQQSVSLTTSD